MSPEISAVVVNYQQRDLLRACLDALAIALRNADVPHETIVVDNGSTDGSIELVRDEFPNVHLVKLTKNHGFAGGVVQGIRAASGTWVLCINNDAFAAPDAISELMRVANSAEDDVGSIAALMVFADRTDIVNSAGIEVDRLGIAWDRLMGEPVTAVDDRTSEVFGPSAGAALYRRSMLEDVPFDESFFAYREDVDVAWRARMRGWRSLLAPRAVVRHEFSATARHGSDLKHYWSGRNRVRVLARNASGRQLLRSGPAIFLFDLAYVAFVLATERSTAPIRGRIDGLRSWRRDRRLEAEARRPLDLAPFIGFRSAMRQHRVLRAQPPPVEAGR